MQRALLTACAALSVPAWALRRPGLQAEPCAREPETHAPLCSLDPWLRPPAYLKSFFEQDVRTFEPYVAQPRAPPKGAAYDPNTTALVFLHISKSGGMTVRDVLSALAKRKGLGDVEMVTGRRGWTRVLSECADLARRTVSPLCNQALYSSTNGLGLCDYIGKRYCVYVTVLREPLARLHSSYNYFCTLGREGAKGWLPGWSHCHWSEEQWAGVMSDFLTVQLGTSQAPLRRLTPRQAASQCADCPYLSTAPSTAPRPALLQAARQNLASGAIRPILLEKLGSGLQELGLELGLPELAEEAGKSKPENVHAHSQRDAGSEERLRSSRALAPDLELFQYVSVLPK